MRCAQLLRFTFTFTFTRDLLYVATILLPHVKLNRVFSHDFTAATLVSQNNETAAMLLFQSNPDDIAFTLLKNYGNPKQSL